MKGKKSLCRFAGVIAVMVFVGSALSVLPGFAGESKWQIKNGSIFLDSPFVLEIGSTEYAKALGGLIRTSAHANYDPNTKTTTTNYHHYADARLTVPYFGHDRLSLSFKGEEKALERCSLAIGRWASAKVKVMSYAECRETVDRIAADMGKRLGITMRCTSESSEEEAKEGVRESLAECKRKQQEKCHGLSRSFVDFVGEKTVKNVLVDYSVCGMIDEKGRCNILVSYSKHRDLLSSWKRGDKIPVYTNEMYSATSGKLVPTEEQKRAHEEAKRLRETVNRLFGIDLDRPAETNELSSAAWQTNALATAKREWTPLATPFEGMTERKVSQTVSILAIPFGTFALRRPFGGDVAESELKAQAKRVLDRIEREYGAKIPESDQTAGKALLTKMYGEGVPTFGDTKVLFGFGKTSYFAGKVGDLSIEISYAAPRYAKKGDRFEIVCKGAVVVNIIQSPVITLGRTKALGSRDLGK